MISESLQVHPSRFRAWGRWGIPLAVLRAAYFALLIPTLSRHGVAWDEQVDGDVARAYLRTLK